MAAAAEVVHQRAGTSVLVHVLVHAAALWVATLVVSGTATTAREGHLQQAVAFVVVGAVFGVVDTAVRPVVELLVLLVPERSEHRV